MSSGLAWQAGAPSSPDSTPTVSTSIVASLKVHSFLRGVAPLFLPAQSVVVPLLKDWSLICSHVVASDTGLTDRAREEVIRRISRPAKAMALAMKVMMTLGW
jgi:hypothetical protein